MVHVHADDIVAIDGVKACTKGAVKSVRTVGGDVKEFAIFF